MHMHRDIHIHTYSSCSSYGLLYESVLLPWQVSYSTKNLRETGEAG